jgi:predicted ArsR family transcriptional regulator
VTQPSLFDPPPATYARGTFPGSRKAHTSKAAAHSIAAEIGARHLEVLKALVVLREATADEIASRIDRHPYVVRPRATELQKRGFITQTGDTRMTPTGRQANVLKLTQNGAQYLAYMVHSTR